MFKIISISLLSLIISCSEKQEQPKSQLDNLPNWVLNPHIEGTISAVGIAPRSNGGLQFQIPKAEADARANIAAQIETVVSRLTKDALREAKIGELNEVENVFSQATKNLVKEVPLAGARRVNMFKDPADGTLYIHMSIDNQMIADHLNKNQQIIDSTVASANLSRKNIQQAQDAVKDLFVDLNNELKAE
ncbi:MAG: LPP20 family lipoprotein [Rickettsiales bacterium]|nr:LPP20 family lipoprotein [Rickettsiales bacterium]